MLMDGEYKKSMVHKNITQEDIDEALKIPIEHKVMGYSMFTYEEQI
jgi:hypothetical protein